MSMFKRIVALTMAMITCASFCLSVNAQSWSENFNPDVTSAYARMEINEWPQDTGSTDLHAITLAWGSDYYSEDYISCTAYVDLGIMMEDGVRSSDDQIQTIYDDSAFGVIVSGNDLLRGEPYYAIIDIDSYHYVEITEKVYYNDGESWYRDTYYDGDPIFFNMYDQ